MDSSERFSGLSNQGATCYMNSLLQTLFMTPEFLYRIYKWTWDKSRHESKKYCIPYQLQLMFAKLHLRSSSVVETTGLTTSFQWDLRECLQQHDVQEFCRELFEAIEKSVKGTAQEKMITELYEGTYVDYVTCLQCGNESDREDMFLDLSLAVQGHDSLEKALKDFVKPDMLCGDNKYFCDKCNEKTDAKKGLKLKKIPYVLALQLKRFDLDYSTMQRKKINDRVSFPLILDMGVFLKDYEEIDFEVSDLSNEKYELFSIMIHSGSALGGHYFAYIKSFLTKKWHSFNDSTVKEIEETELEKAVGGTVGSGLFGSNAYMFMYRKMTKDNLTSIEHSEIPSYLLEDIRSEEEEKMIQKKLLEERLLQIEILIHTQMIQKNIAINKTHSLFSLKRKALFEFKLNINEENARFRKYDSNIDQLYEGFDEKEHMSLEALDITADSHLWLELKFPDEKFFKVRPHGLHLKLFVWQDGENEIFKSNIYRLTVPLDFRLRDLVGLLSEHFRLPFENIRLWRFINFRNLESSENNELVEMTSFLNYESRLLFLKMTDGFALYMEEKQEKSRWNELYQKNQPCVFLNFCDPKSNMMSYSLSEAKSSKVGSLKEKIGNIIDVKPDQMIIRRGSCNGQKLLDDELSLQEAGLYCSCNLYIDKEPAIKKDYISIRVYYSGLSISGDDCEWHSFYELFLITVPVSAGLQQLKDVLKKEALNIYPSMNFHLFRIREKVDRRLVSVVTDLKSLSDVKCPEVSIEEEEDVDGSEIICLFRYFNPETWELSSPKTLNIQQDISLEDLESVLQVEFTLDFDLEITRITYSYSFIRGELKKANWVKMKGFLAKSPLFVTSHGSCFV